MPTTRNTDPAVKSATQQPKLTDPRMSSDTPKAKETATSDAATVVMNEEKANEILAEINSLKSEFSARLDNVMEAVEKVRKETNDCVERVTRVQAADIRMDPGGAGFEFGVALERAHHIGPKGDTETRPRTLIMRFLSYKSKVAVIAAARSKKEIRYENQQANERQSKTINEYRCTVLELQSLTTTYKDKTEMMTKDSTRRGIVSDCYRIIVAHHSDGANDRRAAWQDDLRQELSKEDWEKACGGAHTKFINARLRLIQHKYLMRTYVTPERLKKYNSNIPDTCVKCAVHKGTLYHCVWECTEIKKFWEDVRISTEKIIKKDVPLDAKLFLIGLCPNEYAYSKCQRVFLDLSLMVAKKCIAMAWKSLHRPTVRDWMKQMLQVMPLERITYILKAKQHLFDEIWTPFLTYIKRMDLKS
uniref:Reverse transcriptase zinc-binding domain-containing protein n=1 Tax=Nothobranchius pienaari TaxID=704102 RepID=A0A1A8LJG6_9TELE